MDFNEGAYQHRPENDEPVERPKQPVRYSPRVLAELRGQPIDWSAERPVSAGPQRVYDPLLDRRVPKAKLASTAVRQEKHLNQITVMATATKPKPAAFIRFNAETALNSRERRCTVSFGNAGAIFFSELACAAMGINADSKVSIFQDPDNKSAWYAALDPEHGFKLRENEKAKGYGFNSSSTCKAIKASLGLDEKKTAVLPIGAEPEFEHEGAGYHAIITAGVKGNK